MAFWQAGDSSHKLSLLDSHSPINQCIYLYHNKDIIYTHNLSEMTTSPFNIIGNIYAWEETPHGSPRQGKEEKMAGDLLYHSSTPLCKAKHTLI